MSINTKLAIKATDYRDNKKTVTDTITYVNPNISNTVALELAQRVNALTNNSYLRTDKIDTTELDSITPKGQRTISSMRYYKGIGSEQTMADFPDSGVLNLIANSDVTKSFIFFIKTPYDGTAPVLVDFTSTSNALWVSCQFSIVTNATVKDCWRIMLATHEYQAVQSDLTPGTVSFTLHFDETNQYEAYDKPITINITEG